MLEAVISRQPQLPRFLCHLYQRLKLERLNLVTGAGISIDAKVPGWNPLLKRLSESDPQLAQDVETHFSDGRHPEYLGQIVYHRRSNGVTETEPRDLHRFRIDHEWAKAVHEALYKDVPDKIDDVLSSHPYLAQLVDLTDDIPLIINFNFDDILASAIDRRIAEKRRTRTLSLVWRPPLVERPKTTTIYHVNGVLPRTSLKKRSEQLVFTEDSFADAMARAPGVEIEYTFLRFVQNTMLIVGHSLTDSSLKNYLRRSKEKNPANHHYMVYWMPNPDKVSESIRNDLFLANLELYNVITLFMSSADMQELFSVMTMQPRGFTNLIDALEPDRRACFKYYIVGPVGAGKSTLLEHLRCFETYEEWTRPPPPEMYMDFTKLTQEQAERVDSFIYDELKEKNAQLNSATIGFHFMDRAPLDLYAFSKDHAEQQKKTARLKDQVTRNTRFVDADIIFISADGKELVKRNLKRGRPPEEAGSAQYFDEQKATLAKIYAPTNVFNTEEGAGALARRVARHALLGPYTTTDLNAIMERYS